MLTATLRTDDATSNAPRPPVVIRPIVLRCPKPSPATDAVGPVDLPIDPVGLTCGALPSKAVLTERIERQRHRRLTASALESHTHIRKVHYFKSHNDTSPLGKKVLS